jgi:hypothetical protein
MKAKWNGNKWPQPRKCEMAIRRNENINML